MDKQEILDWYCKRGTCISPCQTIKCANYKDLSSMLDGLIDSAYDYKKVEEETATGTMGKVFKIKGIEDWKTEAKKGGRRG